MTELHGAFIWSAYAVSALVLAGIVIVSVIDWRRQKQQLDILEKSGARRRRRARDDAACGPDQPAGKQETK